MNILKGTEKPLINWIGHRFFYEPKPIVITSPGYFCTTINIPMNVTVFLFVTENKIDGCPLDMIKQTRSKILES